MSSHRSCLSGLLTRHCSLHVNQSEGINNNFASYRLNRIDNNCDTLRVQLLKRLLSVYIHTRQPTTETGMRVVPPHYVFVPLGLLKHVEHVLLIHWIHRLDRHQVAALGHGEYVHDLDGVLVDCLPEHQAHDFEGHTGSAVL